MGQNPSTDDKDPNQPGKGEIQPAQDFSQFKRDVQKAHALYVFVLTSTHRAAPNNTQTLQTVP